MRLAPGAAEVAARERALLDVFPGARVLDVGCGTGEDARAFAAAAGDRGAVTGVDGDPEMVRIAQARTSASASEVRFLNGDAQDLALEDGTFDRCFSSRLLHQVSAPEQVVAEMVRVTASGGIVVLSMEPDWDTLVIDVPSRELARRVIAQRSECFPNPWSGRRLYGLAHRAGLLDVGVTTHTYLLTALEGDAQPLSIPWANEVEVMQERGLLSVDEMDEWLQTLRAADAAQAFFAAVTFFTAFGRRP